MYRLRSLSVAGLLLAGLVLQAPPAQAVRSFQDDFESGDLRAWSVGAGLTDQQVVVHLGSWAARTTTGTGAAWLNRKVHSVPEMYLDMWFNPLSQASWARIAALKALDGTTLASVGLTTSHRLYVSVGNGGADPFSGPLVSMGGWHQLQLHVLDNGGSSVVDVWLDGVLVSGLSGPAVLPDSSIASLEIGDRSASHVFDAAFDDVITSSGYIDVTPPSRPTKLFAKWQPDSTVLLTWRASTDDVGVDHYTIYEDGRAVDMTPDGATTSYVDDSPQLDRSYTVDAVDAAGNHSPQSAPAVVDLQPPTTPTGLQATPVGTNGSVQLSWNASTDNVALADYAIYRDGVEIGTTPDGDTTTYQDIATPGTLYEYRVTAVDTSSNESPPSDPVNIVPTVGDTRPNIVLILTDDQRLNNSQDPADTTVSHMPIVQSQLADKGVTFTNGFVVNPLCCPSRTTMLTGMDSGHTGVWNNKPPYGGFATFTSTGDDQSTIATWLDGANYRTAYIGKYLNGYAPSDAAYVPPGWDQWDALALTTGTGSDAEGSPGYYNYSLSANGQLLSYGSHPADYSTDVLAGDAVNFIDTAPDAHPLFMVFAPRAPHNPATPADQYATGCPGLPLNRPPNWNEADVSDKPPYIQSLSPTNRDKFNLNQCRTLLSVDDAVGNILQALTDQGRLQNTLILFASDNGLANGEHRWNKKTVPYEESIRVPMIMRYDPLTAQTPTVDAHLVLNMDIAPTFADAAGVQAPSGVQGSSLLPLLQGTGDSWRTDFLIEHGGNVAKVPAYCGVHTKAYVYVRYSDGFEELYDLKTDPFELDNVAGDPTYATIEDGLRSRMVTMCSPPPPGYVLP